jgi:hypothetical protein
MAWDTSSVTIGNSTKKADYDRLRANDQAIASGSFTFYGVKTFGTRPNFYSPVAGESGAGILHFKTSLQSLFVTASYSSSAKRSASVATYVPSGTVAILLISDMILAKDDMVVFYRSSVTAAANICAQHARGTSGGGASLQLIVGLDANRKYYWKKTTTATMALAHSLLGYWV